MYYVIVQLKATHKPNKADRENHLRDVTSMGPMSLSHADALSARWRHAGYMATVTEPHDPITPEGARFMSGLES